MKHKNDKAVRLDLSTTRENCGLQKVHVLADSLRVVLFREGVATPSRDRPDRYHRRSKLPRNFARGMFMALGD